MKLALRVLVVSVASLGLLACGGGAKIGGGKQGAASALFVAGSEGKNTGGALLQLAGSAAGSSDLTAACQFGGSATLSAYSSSVDTAAGKITQTFTLQF